MYFDQHTSMGNAVADTLFAIEEGNESLIVIVGESGYGKTMTLRVILDSLKQERYRVAFVPNPDMTFRQLLREIIGQLTGEACAASKRHQLLEIFNQLLLKTTAKGKRVLIFIDDANTMTPTTLERQRLLTDMLGDNDNLFSIVMAGQRELTRPLEHPQCANLFQHIGVSCQLTKIESRHLMRHYIEYRLERAGSSQRLFTEEAYDAIWERSEKGIPRLINLVAKLALKTGQAAGVPLIDGAIVQHLSSRLDDTAKAMSRIWEEQGRDVPHGLRGDSSRPAMSETTSALA
jgi:MSHA biogenesis protein MshM